MSYLTTMKEFELCVLLHQSPHFICVSLGKQLNFPLTPVLNLQSTDIKGTRRLSVKIKRDNNGWFLKE